MTGSCNSTPHTPPGMKEHSHIPKEVTFNTDKLLKDVTNWPQKSVCWSAKINEYLSRGYTNDAIPPTEGQIIKEFFKSKRVDITSFEPPSGGENRQITYTCTFMYTGGRGGGQLTPHFGL